MASLIMDIRTLIYKPDKLSRLVVPDKLSGANFL